MPLTRPPSPSIQDHFPHITQDHERPPTPSRSQSAPHLADHDMGQTKERSHVEILLDSQHLKLRGTGVDVEPTRLSGHVVLFLSEDMPLKEITLQFRGKARIPVPASDSLLNSNASSVTYVVCNHEWSFLEGDKRHARTVKAGRHVFPFNLNIGGSLPSTIGTSVFGGASVCYKLRAIAVRPGLSHNLQVITPIHIDRSFSHEALEYQQTLEIENTWPEKLMYSIVLPHKAWAAGDKLTAILKFSPLAKGVHVQRIRTTIQETTKIYARSGAQEVTHPVASINHDIVDGKPVFVNPRSRFTLMPQSNNATQHRNATAGPSSGSEASSLHGASSPLRSTSPPDPPSTSTQGNAEPQEEGEGGDLVMAIAIPLPIAAITPSHSVEPITVSHRVRWNILIRNMDGHTSELRCSLPIHILDNRLLEEARSFSAATRRLVLGSSELPPEEEEDRELPSYAAHIRDRVANMFLPEAATVRVNNPWINHVGTSQPSVEAQESSSSSRTRSGFSTPLEPHHLSHLPHAPGPDEFPTLDLLQSELLLSLSDSRLRRDFFTPPEPRTPSDQTSFDFSQPPSRSRSRPQSRHNSRPPSPDGTQRHHHHHHHHDDASIHHGNGQSRNLHSIFRATMKPFTSLGHHHSLFSRHGSHHSHDDTHHASHLPTPQTDGTAHRPQRSGTMTPSDQLSGTDLLHRMLTEVPDYSIASRGFLGGVPPLESMRGLPSYEEASRETAQRATSSDTDLTAGIASLNIDSGATTVNRGPSMHDRAPRLERRCSFPSLIPPSTGTS